MNFGFDGRASTDVGLHLLALFRLTHMITEESGPFWLFRLLRRWVKREAPRKAHMDEGIECPFCMSMQLASVMTALHYWLYANSIYETSILALALSGGAVLIHEILRYYSKSK